MGYEPDRVREKKEVHARRQYITDLWQSVPGQRYVIHLENVPVDMDWQELNEIASELGESVIYSHVFQRGRRTEAFVHYVDKKHAEHALKNLNNRRISGEELRLKAYAYGNWDV